MCIAMLKLNMLAQKPHEPRGLKFILCVTLSPYIVPEPNLRLKSERMGILINRIPGSHLLISSLPSSALKTHVEWPDKPRDVNKRSQSLAL